LGRVVIFAGVCVKKHLDKCDLGIIIAISLYAVGFAAGGMTI
jgi:Ni/Fe-hydrogenase subunit HybB-like protein